LGNCCISDNQIEQEAKKYGLISFSGLNLDSSSIPQFISFKIDFNLVTTFDVEGNKLSSIPNDIERLVNLIELNLSKNNIDRFSTPHLPALRRFNIGFNPLVELPSDLDMAPKLELIICHNCKLRSLPIECLKRMPTPTVIVNGNYLSIGHDHIPCNIVDSLQGIHDQHVSSEILSDFLYLGSVASAQSWEELERLQIRHIVCMVNMFELPFAGKVTYKMIQIDDIETANVKQYFPIINQFVTSVKNAGGRCLIHCHAGVSRSSSAVIAYLMVSMKITYKEAREYVFQRRPCICPNDGFERQLIEYEQEILTQCNIRSSK